ncbi:MAG: serine/threonine-protein kinase [Myxococcota bacterium]
MGQGIDSEVETLTVQGQPREADAHTPTHKLARPPSSEALTPGERIGRYRLVQRIGRGGMGVVWEADDPELDRAVAIKLLLERGRADDRAQERLRREGLALARLSHPNVVSIYDVGVHRGRVFLAMELVKGQTLSAWARRGPHSPKRMLEVLEAAAQGLGAVHDAGFVHRDFKPANVMLDDDGRVLVMDFGLARLVERQAPGSLDGTTSVVSLEPTGDLTRDGMVVGTPPYMAPEQHHTVDIDARADQYAFCVTAFQLWLGRRPFDTRDFEALARDKHRANFDFEDAKVPVPRELRGVLTRGLSPEPDGRFESMHALRAQLAKVGRGRSARSWAIASVVGLSLLGWISRWAIVDDRAEACDAGAQRIDSIWGDEKSEQLRAAFVATGRSYAADAYERAARRLDDYADDWRSSYERTCMGGGDPGPAADEDLDLKMRCLSDAHGSMSTTVELLLDADARVVSSAVQQVAGLPQLARCEDLAILRSTVPLPADPRIRREAEKVDTDLEIAWAHGRVGRYDEGEERARQALVRAQALGHPPTIGRARVIVARFGLMRGDTKQAAEALIEATHFASSIDDYELAADTATTLVHVEAQRLGRFDEARRWARHAQSSIDRLPPDPAMQARLDGNLGVMLAHEGKYEEALEHFQRAHDVLVEALGEDHPEVATALERLALCVHQMGRFESARDNYEHAVEIFETVFGPKHPSLAHVLTNLAETVAVLSERERANALYRRAIEIYRESTGDRTVPVARALGGLGDVAVLQERFEEAKKLYAEAQAIYEDAVEPGHPEIGWNWIDQARLRVAMGQPTEALALFQRARDLLEAVHGPSHGVVAQILVDEGVLALELGRIDDAAERFALAEPIVDANFSPEEPAMERVHWGRARLHLARGELTEARTALTEAMRIARLLMGDRNGNLVLMLLTLTEVEQAAGRHEVARGHLREALALAQSNDVGPATRAKVQWALARELGTDPAASEEALRSARAARTRWASFGEVFAPRLTDIDAWLGLRGEQP